MGIGFLPLLAPLQAELPRHSGPTPASTRFKRYAFPASKGSRMSTCSMQDTAAATFHYGGCARTKGAAYLEPASEGLACTFALGSLAWLTPQ